MSDVPQPLAPKPAAGPWIAVENEGAFVQASGLTSFRIETAPESGRDFCVALVMTDTPEADNRATAHLIAAAPELLQACKAAEEWLSSWASAEPYIETIRAAIAKAERTA